MTISTTYAPVQYTGNGVTTVFAFPYVFFDDTDLIVSFDGVVQSTGYTISGGSGEDGDVTFSTAPTSGVIVTIELSLPYTQEDDYVENQAFPADTLERGLDKAAIRDQQLNASIGRAVKYPLTISGITSFDMPAPVDGAAIVFDGVDGTLVASDTYIADAISDATAGVTGTSLITATSTTSLATTGTGSKTWTIQSGRGFAMGQRLRVASDDGTKINEGVVTSYSGTSLTINVDYVSGSGTHADWNISVTGDRGASGTGSGDMLASQNLNDVASKPTAFNTIKQSATDTSSGVVELATNAEVLAGTDTGRAITPAGLAGGTKRILQHSYKSTTTADSTALNVPDDNTIPQNTECKLGLAADAFTPKSATSKLRISYSAMLSNSSASTTGMLLLFKDSDAGAMKISPALVGNGDPTTISDYYEMVAGTTSAITFKLYFGGISNTTYFLSDNGTTKWGGTVMAHIKIEEIDA